MECIVMFFFFNDTATTEIYTLSLHDALPIYDVLIVGHQHPDHRRGISLCRLDHAFKPWRGSTASTCQPPAAAGPRSEEHTSELQSRQYLVCRLLLEKKNNSSYLSLHGRHYIT